MNKNSIFQIVLRMGGEKNITQSTTAYVTNGRRNWHHLNYGRAFICIYIIGLQKQMWHKNSGPCTEMVKRYVIIDFVCRNFFWQLSTTSCLIRLCEVISSPDTSTLADCFVGCNSMYVYVHMRRWHIRAQPPRPLSVYENLDIYTSYLFCSARLSRGAAAASFKNI